MKGNRTRSGAFCSQEAMLGEWLGQLLSWTWRNEIPEMLEHAARWCETQAADRLKLGARVLDDKPGVPGWHPEPQIKDCNRHLATRDLLIQTAAKVRGIWTNEEAKF